MRYVLRILLFALGPLSAHAGWFGPDFETIRTQPPPSGEDSVLYMTSNGFTPDEKYFVFGRRHEPRSAARGLGSRHHLYRRNMATGEEVEIAFKPNIGFLNAVVGGYSLFYGTIGTDAAIYQVDVLTGAEKQIWKLPLNERYGKWKLYNLASDRDGKRLAIAFSDEVPVDRGNKLHDWLDQYLASDAHSFIYIGDLEPDGTWTFRKLIELTDVSRGWFGHVQLNPVTGDDLLYELEGRCVNGVWDRAYVIDLKTNAQTPVRHGEEPVCLSHANYVGDGIVQYMLYENHRTTVGFADVRRRSWEEWPAGNHHHFAAFIAPDGTRYAFGDGQAAKPASVMRYTIRGGRIVASDRVGSRGPNTAWEEYHGHPRVSPRGRYLVYTSSDRMEQGQVVIVSDPLKPE